MKLRMKAVHRLRRYHECASMSLENWRDELEEEEVDHEGIVSWIECTQESLNMALALVRQELMLSGIDPTDE